METARDILNKIQTDPKWAKMDYLIEYTKNERKENLRFSKIKEVGKLFLTIDDGDEISIPIHKIKKVYRNQKLVWEIKF